MNGVVDGPAGTDVRAEFRAGVVDAVPVFSGTVPFAVVVGVTGVEFGFTSLEITAMSALVYAGAAQLAAIVLVSAAAHPVVVVLTVGLINLRFAMYSASLAPNFRPLSRLRKALYPFLLVDTIYALSTARSRTHSDAPVHWYYLGGGLAFWASWVAGTAVGAVLGSGIPAEFPAALVLPLVFLALLAPLVEDRPAAVTALVAGGVAVVAAPLAYNVGLLIATVCGLAVGVALDR
jgi:4-azaleucine resistance transporter AzlC